MEKPVLTLKPSPKPEPAKPAAQPTPPKPKIPDNPVEIRFLGFAAKLRRKVRFIHNDGTITEGPVIAYDRYLIELAGDLILFKQNIKSMQLLPRENGEAPTET